MRIRLGAAIFFLLLSCCLQMTGARAWGAGDAQPGVVFVDGMLSVSVRDMPLGSLLDEVAKKAKVTVFVADEVKGLRVSSLYSGLPLKNGLIRILEDAGINSYLLVYRDNEQKMVSELFVMKGDKTPAGSSPSAAGRMPGNAPYRPAEVPGTGMTPPMMPMPQPSVPSQDSPEPVPFEPLPGSQGEEMPPIPVPMPFPPVDPNSGGMPQPHPMP